VSPDSFTSEGKAFEALTDMERVAEVIDPNIDFLERLSEMSLVNISPYTGETDLNFAGSLVYKPVIYIATSSHVCGSIALAP
jgi:hypothetical protein